MVNIKPKNSLPSTEILWNRPVSNVRATGGRMLIIGGSRGKIAELLRVSDFALRTKPQHLSLAYPKSLLLLLDKIIPQESQIILTSTPSGSIASNNIDSLLETVSRFDTIVLGPGISTNQETTAFVVELIEKCTIPIIVIDDGVKILHELKVRLPDILGNYSGDGLIIITSDKAEYYIGELKETLTKNIFVVNTAKNLSMAQSGAVETLIPDSSSNFRFSDQALGGMIGVFISQNRGRIKSSVETALWLFIEASKGATLSSGISEVTTSALLSSLDAVLKSSEIRPS